MNRLRRCRLNVLAAGLASITALIHSYLGLTKAIQYVTTGYTPELLSILFAISAPAIIAGMLIFYREESHSPIYPLMAVYIVGYVDRHVFGTAESVLGLEEAGHDRVNDHDHAHERTQEEDESARQLLIAHLVEDPFAFVSKIAEMLLLITLGILYYAEISSRKTNANVTE